jgi:peptidyl-prolyl cis-trans isomerase C
MIKKLGIPALVAIAAMNVAACNKDGDAAKAVDKPVATVNGKAIPQSVFDVVAQGQTNKKPEELTAEQRKQVLDQLVDLYVVAQQAEKEKLGTDSEVTARLEFQRLNTLASALVQKQMKGKTPSEAEVRAEYDRTIAQLPKLEYHARHILVKEEKEAQDAIAALKKGAKFEDLAKKISIDGSKAQGGDLSWFTPDHMVKPFAEALEQLKKGEYTQTPVKSEFGWHVILLEDTRPNNPPAFETVKDRVAPMVQQRQLKEYVEGLRKTATVTGL